MSSSTASNAASTGHGQCVVCGKESTTACSVCRKAGLDWMYFCSREHQKLIWKIHKRVCGQNPFKYPALSEAEAQELWEMRDSQVVEGKSWSERLIMDANRALRGTPGLGTTFGVETVEERDSSFKLLLSNGRVEAESRSRVDSYNDFIRGFRAQAFDAKVHSLPFVGELTVPTSMSRSLVVGDPFGFMAWLMAHHARAQFKKDPFSDIDGSISDAWSTFHHRLLILLAKMAADLASSTDNRDLNSPGNLSSLSYLINSCKLVISSSQNQPDLETYKKLMEGLTEFIGCNSASILDQLDVTNDSSL